MTNELSDRNFKRIAVINWLMLLPLVMLFAWPYLELGQLLGFDKELIFVGAFFFSMPFTLTILHGHVTMALGAPHRHHYYEWLESKRFSYGFGFNAMYIRTRFRLSLLTVNLIIFFMSVWL